MPLKSQHPRIEPVEPPYDGATQAALDLLGPPISLFRVFARNPDRAHGLAGWGHYYLSRRLSLTLRQREIVIDRTVARRGADYEWGVHVLAYAEKVGLTPSQLRSLARGTPSDDCWDPSDRAVVAAVDELCDTSDLSDATWAALVAEVGEEGVMDVVLLTGWYHAIAFAARALRLPLEPGTQGLDHDRAPE